MIKIGVDRKRFLVSMTEEEWNRISSEEDVIRKDDLVALVKGAEQQLVTLTAILAAWPEPPA